MADTIVYVDTSNIREGMLSEVKTAMRELAEFVELNEPQLMSYEFYLSQDETQMTVIAIHPDAASLEFHMEIGGSAFRKFADLIELLRIDIFGKPSALALRRLNDKARMLGRGAVEVHDRRAGFARLRAQESP